MMTNSSAKMDRKDVNSSMKRANEKLQSLLKDEEIMSLSNNEGGQLDEFREEFTTWIDRLSDAERKEMFGTVLKEVPNIKWIIETINGYVEELFGEGKTLKDVPYDELVEAVSGLLNDAIKEGRVEFSIELKELMMGMFQLRGILEFFLYVSAVILNELGNQLED